jgi:MinD-like ATPase involved in chromosome partitioning or flagellar assembly
MSVHYDNALLELLQTCDRHGTFEHVERACVIRDLRGRLRLVCKVAPAQPQPQPEPDWAALEAALTAALGAWFAGPVLHTRSQSAEVARAAQALLAQPENQGWPTGWPAGLPDRLGVLQPLPTRWCGSNRVLTKESWLDQRPQQAIWPFVEGAAPPHFTTPLVVSFFSFKGGVGRTTALALVARRMAMDGKRVVVVDLDLEAPGLAPFFGRDPDLGVIDALLAHGATGALSLAGLLEEQVDAQGATLSLIGAGRLGWGHVEKLARLDYLHGSGEAQSPVERGLRALLAVLKAKNAYDVILLDARAGLHDLGGLALHGLAHIDVLVGRDNAQSRLGMQLVAKALARKRRANGGQPNPPQWTPNIVVAHTFVPTAGAQAAEAAYRAALHQLFSAELYDPNQVPGIDDATKPHYAQPIRDFGSNGAPSDLASADSSFYDHGDYKALAERILRAAP